MQQKLIVGRTIALCGVTALLAGAGTSLANGSDDGGGPSSAPPALPALSTSGSLPPGCVRSSVPPEGLPGVKTRRATAGPVVIHAIPGGAPGQAAGAAGAPTSALPTTAPTPPGESATTVTSASGTATASGPEKGSGHEKGFVTCTDVVKAPGR